MQKLCLLVLVLAGSLRPSPAEPMKQGERDRLIAHLEMTENWLRDEVRSLTAEQWRFRSSPEKWSVLDVVEHLTIAEPQYWKWVQDSMAKPALTEKLPFNEAAILWYGIDRTQRNKTAEARTPSGRLVDPVGAMASFGKLRSEMMSYAKSTQEDLKMHRLNDSQMDVYAWFLMISSHSQRHILQIREIKAHPEFPKATSAKPVGSKPAP
jgi:hypothetical protein